MGFVQTAKNRLPLGKAVIEDPGRRQVLQFIVERHSVRLADDKSCQFASQRRVAPGVVLDFRARHPGLVVTHEDQISRPQLVLTLGILPVDHQYPVFQNIGVPVRSPLGKLGRALQQTRGHLDSADFGDHIIAAVLNLVPKPPNAEHQRPNNRESPDGAGAGRPFTYWTGNFRC